MLICYCSHPTLNIIANIKGVNLYCTDWLGRIVFIAEHLWLTGCVSNQIKSDLQSC